ncbi:MAG: hypothetical protein SF162_04200 [bacterium]|nr:hypothetical protein [bacterium]
MPANIDLIQLETTDDATTVRDRLSFLRGRSVLLVWPEQGTTLTRKLDLVLIQREAVRSAVKLALVTHDPIVARHAAELNISAFETIGGAQRGRWQRGRSKAFTSRNKRPKDQPAVDELAPVASRLRVEDVSPGQRRVRLAVRVVILLVLVIVSAAVGLIVLPTATVVVLTTRIEVDANTLITADPAVASGQIDVENRVIPAVTLRVEVEERAGIETSGVRSLGATPALGSVVFINTTGAPVEIPAGTFVSTSAGTPIIFRTTQAALVAGGVGLQIEVPIEAIPESAGEIGNDIGVGLINTVIGALANTLEVRNLAPTYGGTSRDVRVVTEADRVRLLDILRQQIQARAYAEIVPRISEDQFIIPETIRITEERDDWTIFDAEAEEASESLSLTMRAIVEATAVDPRFAEQIAYVQLSNQIPRGRSIDLNTIEYVRGGDVALDAAGRVTFSMTARGVIASQVDTVLLQERLAGISVEEAQRFLASTLELTQDTPPQITVTPGWLGRMPLLPMRITIVQGDA